MNDALFYGSPGLELINPNQLGLDPGHAYVMRAPNDPITTYAAPLAPEHGWGLNPYDGMLPELSSQAGFDPGKILRSGVGGHADYPRSVLDSAGNEVLRMSGYNFAAITAGLPDNKVLATPMIHPLFPLGPVPFPPNAAGGR